MLLDPQRERPWDSPALGVPINQMDLAGTVLAFGMVVDEPFKRFHGHSTPHGQDENRFLDRWNTVGELLGVAPNLLANDILDARALLDATRIEWTESPEGSEGNRLMEALLDYMSSWMGGFEAVNIALIHQLAPSDIPPLLHVGDNAIPLPPIAVTALLSRLQRLAVSSSSSNELASLTFELGFKAAQGRAVLDSILSDAPDELLQNLHVDKLTDLAFRLLF
jgi:ER-bound oxygenase mpaB/B'/Rubber oxygenase, catalytic domain